MADVTYSYASVPTLRRFAESNAFIRAILGPFGSGKSSACVVELIRRGQMQQPGPDGIRRTRFVVIRNTYGELKDTTINTVFSWLPPHYFGRYYVADRRFVVTQFDKCEIEILFRALDDPEDVKKLLSLELTGAWVNEAREVPWPVIEALQGRLGRYPAAKDGGCTWFGMWLDTNPPDTDSRFYKFFEEEEWQASFEALLRGGVLAPDMKPTDFVEIFRQPSGLSDEAENLPNLPKGYYQILGIGKKPEWVKVYIHGRYGFVSDDKAIFPGFNELVHVKAVDPIPGVAIQRGWDFGLCYDDQTEVLTFDGWKFFADVDCGRDLIASRDPATGVMEYAEAAFKIAKPYKGEMLEWSSTELNICVTPEHRVPFTYRDSPNKVHWQSAEWLAQHMTGHHYVDLVSAWYGLDQWPMWHLGMEPMVLAEFMGLYLSEGCTEKNRITIYQSRRRPEFERILDATGLDWAWFDHGKSSGWRVTDRDLAAMTKPLGTAKKKRVPQDIRALAPHHIRAFIAAYTLGDGHIRTRKNGSVEHTAFTSSKAMADDLQDLAQKAGWNSSMREVKPQRSVLKGRAIQNGGGYSVTFKKTATRAELLKKNFRRIAYDGTVYCLNVPHHTLYVRRGGKPSWNGNTPACAFSQLLPTGQWLVFDEMVSEDMSIDNFGDDVNEHCARSFRGQAQFEDTGDPAGEQQAQTDARTCFQILQGKGIDIQPGLQSLAIRLESVRKPLRTLVNGEPQFILHPRCKVLRKGFLGGYHFKRLATNAERYSTKPNKNEYSHVMEGLCYTGTILFGGGMTESMLGNQDGAPQIHRSDAGRSKVTGY